MADVTHSAGGDAARARAFAEAEAGTSAVAGADWDDPELQRAVLTLQKRFDAMHAGLDMLEGAVPQFERGLRVESARYRQVLEGIRAPPESLSEDVREAVATVARIAQQLGCADTRRESLVLAMAELVTAVDGADERAATASHELRARGGELRAALAERERARNAASTARTELESRFRDAEARRQGLGYLEDKSKQYHKQILQLKGEVQKSKVDGTLTHSALEELAGSVDSARRAAEPLVRRLESYTDLPPDLALAQLKVAELRREAQRLEEELAQRVAAIELNDE